MALGGSVYVADTNDRIRRYNCSGVFVSKWGTNGSGDGQFYHPHGVAVAPDGSVYVLDSKNDRVQKFTYEGVFISEWGTSGSGDGDSFTDIAQLIVWGELWSAT